MWGLRTIGQSGWRLGFAAAHGPLVSAFTWFGGHLLLIAARVYAIGQQKATSAHHLSKVLRKKQAKSNKVNLLVSIQKITNAL